MDNSLFGWELLTKLIESDVKNAMDLVVALVHWQMVKLSFVCLGTGDDKTIRDSDCGSEKLPEYWNEDCGHYSLRYSLGGCDVYILKCVIIDGSTALFNLYNVSKGTVSHLSFELKEVIACGGDAQRKKLSEMVQKIDVQVIRIREELILPVAGCFNCTNDTMPRPRPPDPKSTQRSAKEMNCLPNSGYRDFSTGQLMNNQENCSNQDQFYENTHPPGAMSVGSPHLMGCGQRQ